MCSIVFFYISFVCHSHRIRVCSYVTCMSVQFNIILHVIRMWLVCSYVTCMPFVCHSYVLVYSYVTRMSSICHLYITRMSPVYHSYVCLCHPYVTCMYAYVTRISLICTSMSPIYHLHVLVCHPYITRMWFYHELLSIRKELQMTEFVKFLLHVVISWYKENFHMIH